LAAIACMLTVVWPAKRVSSMLCYAMPVFKRPNSFLRSPAGGRTGIILLPLEPGEANVQNDRDHCANECTLSAFVSGCSGKLPVRIDDEFACNAGVE
jgi:hypothetical protein